MVDGYMVEIPRLHLEISSKLETQLGIFQAGFLCFILLIFSPSLLRHAHKNTHHNQGMLLWVFECTSTYLRVAGLAAHVVAALSP